MMRTLRTLAYDTPLRVIARRTKSVLIAASAILAVLAVTTGYMLDRQQQVLDSSSRYDVIQNCLELQAEWLRFQTVVALYAVDPARVPSSYLGLREDLVRERIESLDTSPIHEIIAGHRQIATLSAAMTVSLDKAVAALEVPGRPDGLAATLDQMGSINPVLMHLAALTTTDVNRKILKARERLGEILWYLYVILMLLIMLGVALVALLTVHNGRLQAAERALSRSKDAAVKTSAAMQRMLAASTHDLRQPLQSMVLFADVLSATQGRASEPARQDAVNHLQQSMAALKSMLDGLIDVARTGGGIKPRIESFPASVILSQIEAAYVPRARQKNVDFFVVPSDAILRSDPALLSRMVRNLVENALRHTSQGYVMVRCCQDAEGPRIEVVDTGCGIPAPDLDVIWEEFRQLGDRSRDGADGVGLGLSIVRTLAQVLGHEVDVSSAVGMGSKFSVRVQQGFGPSGETALPPDLDAIARRAEAGVLPGMELLCLFIDDDPMVLGGIECAFATIGCETITAASGAGAIFALGEAGRMPDVIVCDYRLDGGESGLAAIQAVRSWSGKEIPALLLTGNIGQGIEDEARRRRIPVAEKPIGPHDLLQLLANIVDQAGPLQDEDKLEPAGALSF